MTRIFVQRKYWVLELLYMCTVLVLKDYIRIQNVNLQWVWTSWQTTRTVKYSWKSYRSNRDDFHWWGYLFDKTNWTGLRNWSKAMSSNWLKSMNIDVFQVWHFKVVHGQRPWHKMEAHVLHDFLHVCNTTQDICNRNLHRFLHLLKYWIQLWPLWGKENVQPPIK